MEEHVVKLSVFLLLLINGILDWKKGEISLLSLGGFGLFGLIWNLCRHYQSLGSLCGGAAVGIGLLAAAFLSCEAVGFGDGLLLCVTGIYLGFWENLSLLAAGALCCAVIQGVRLLLKKVRMTDRIPFVPFLFLAFVGGLLL